MFPLYLGSRASLPPATEHPSPCLRPQQLQRRSRGGSHAVASSQNAEEASKESHPSLHKQPRIENCSASGDSLPLYVLRRRRLLRLRLLSQQLQLGTQPARAAGPGAARPRLAGSTPKDLGKMTRRHGDTELDGRYNIWHWLKAWHVKAKGMHV